MEETYLAGPSEEGPIKGEVCAILHPRLERAGDVGLRTPQADLDEAIGLAAAIDLKVVHSEVIRLQKALPGMMFGKGTVQRIADLLHPEQDDDNQDHGNKIGLVIVNSTLSPVQQRNLERALKCKVIDRTGLILEIFGERARTKEGRLQVELAALSYQRSRLVRSWTHLERQRGGLGFVGGPGETQIETDRRLIDERIVQIKRNLEKVERTRNLHRSARKRVPYRSVSLVGYTNAGKSTLFNHLTKAKVMAKDQLFATLDPTMRKLVLPSGETVILSDTVGFISDLPHELVTAFQATLEEVCQADMIIHVRDIAHPDTDAQKIDVMDVLQKLKVINNDDAASDTIMIEVINKIDLLSDDEIATLKNKSSRQFDTAEAVSAISGEGLEALCARIETDLTTHHITVNVDVEYQHGAGVAWLYEYGKVLERRDEEDGIHICVRLSPPDLERLKERDDVSLVLDD